MLMALGCLGVTIHSKEMQEVADCDFADSRVQRNDFYSFKIATIINNTDLTDQEKTLQRNSVFDIEVSNNNQKQIPSESFLMLD